LEGGVQLGSSVHEGGRALGLALSQPGGWVGRGKRGEKKRGGGGVRENKRALFL